MSTSIAIKCEQITEVLPPRKCTRSMAVQELADQMRPPAPQNSAHYEKKIMTETVARHFTQRETQEAIRN